MTWEVITGDAFDVLSMTEDDSAQQCVTSPPYYGLRDYGTGVWDGGDPACLHRGEPMRTRAYINANMGTGADVKNAQGYQFFKDVCGLCGARRVDAQIGVESSPQEYVDALVHVFREVRRVLKPDGTFWLNIGDSYAGAGGHTPGKRSEGIGQASAADGLRRAGTPAGLKSKDLIGVPWMLAFALRADGWYLRSEIIWNKPNAMPESVTDRPSKSHETVFLLSKSESYFFNMDAVKEPATDGDTRAGRAAAYTRRAQGQGGDGTTPTGRTERDTALRNLRDVWTINTQPYPEAHFATYPLKLVETCILAGSDPGDLVIDPFSGAGTTGVGAVKHSRHYRGIELNPEYAEMSRRRIKASIPPLWGWMEAK